MHGPGTLDGTYTIGHNVTTKWREGDTFKLIIDFEKKEITLVYNDKDMGIIYRDIPEKIHAAISVYFPVEILCTKYE